MARSKKPEERKQRGGRKRGTWTLLKPEVLLAWRKTHKVSRARLAAQIGVSSTSIQNWETGMSPASLKSQQRLAELIAAGPAILPPPRRNATLWTRVSGECDATIQVTGTIVTQYVQSRKDLSADELVGLIRSVRQALS